MVNYVARRLGWLVIVMLAVTFISYAIFFLLPPGDPALRFAGKNPTPESLAEVRRQFGLDGPFYEQYGTFVKHLVLGDEYGWPGLGFSFETRSSVRDEIIERVPRTLWLIAGAVVLWLAIGLATGVVSALKRGTLVDRLAMGFALLGLSAPVFWLGLMGLFVFWEKLGWLPGTGYVPIAESAWGWFTHLILPWVVLSLSFAAIYARMSRSALLEVLGHDYIRTARAKGLSERRVVLKHGLRASLNPIVTMVGLDIALLVGGAVITERVFNIRGLGDLALTSVFDQDFPLILGVVVVSTAAVVLMSLLVDLAYRYLDPRVRYA